jgi:hypothetical protein
MSDIQTHNVPHSNIFPSPMAAGFGQSSFDPACFSSNNKEYLKPTIVVEMTPR